MVAAGNIIRASDVNNLVKLYYAEGAAGTNTIWTAGAGTTRQDVAGLTFDVVTINPNAIVIATWVIDCFITTPAAGNNFQFRLEVDGVAQSGLAILSTTTDDFRATVTAQQEVVHVLPGTYTYAVTGLSGAAGAAASVDNDQSRLTAICVDLAA